jgi:hypothetical protein
VKTVPLVDEVVISKAAYNKTNGALSITALSRDSVAAPALQAFMPGVTEPLGTLANGQLNVTFPVIIGGQTYVIPPNAITVQSAIGGSATALVDAFLPVQPAAPAVPTLISPSGTITTASPTYTWVAVPTAENYVLYTNIAGVEATRTLTAVEAGCSTGSGLCTATALAPLANGSSVYWVVRATNTGGTSAWSSNLRFTVSTQATPVAPTLVSPSGVVTTATPTYTWNAVAGAANYTLYTNIGGVETLATYNAAAAGCPAGTGTCSVIPATPLAHGSSVYWVVNASNAAGTSPYSTNLRFNVSTIVAPVAPTLVSPSGVAATNPPTYTWNAVANADSYTLYTNIAGAETFTTITAANAGCGAGTGTCSLTPATPLASGASVYWIVNARNAGGTSPWSTNLRFTAP